MQEIDLLFNNKAVVNKPDALQWLFFRECVSRLFNFHSTSQFDSLTKTNRAQLKFETEDKLRKFYLRPGRKVNFVFRLANKKDIRIIFPEEGDNYPDLGGYSVLIHEITDKRSEDEFVDNKALKEYAERIVTEAVDLEFKAYMALPEIMDEKILNKWFHPAGTAKKEILNILLRHKGKGWILSNAMNPSTKRILSLKIMRMEREEILASSMEYWYLRWWDMKRNTYVYFYRETNRQQYILKIDRGTWKIYENLRPAPRTSVANRRKYVS